MPHAALSNDSKLQVTSKIHESHRDGGQGEGFVVVVTTAVLHVVVTGAVGCPS